MIKYAPGTRKKKTIRKVHRLRGMFTFRKVPATFTKKMIKNAMTADLSSHFKNLSITFTHLIIWGRTTVYDKSVSLLKAS